MTDEELDEIARRRIRALQASFARAYEEFWASPAANDLMRRLWSFEQWDNATHGVTCALLCWEGEGGRS